jgi:hypothetical protein
VLSNPYVVEIIKDFNLKLPSFSSYSFKLSARTVFSRIEQMIKTEEHNVNNDKNNNINNNNNSANREPPHVTSPTFLRNKFLVSDDDSTFISELFTIPSSLPKNKNNNNVKKKDDHALLYFSSIVIKNEGFFLIR